MLEQQILRLIQSKQSAWNRNLLFVKQSKDHLGDSNDDEQQQSASVDQNIIMQMVEGPRANLEVLHQILSNVDWNQVQYLCRALETNDSFKRKVRDNQNFWRRWLAVHWPSYASQLDPRQYTPRQAADYFGFELPKMDDMKRFQRGDTRIHSITTFNREIFQNAVSTTFIRKVAYRENFSVYFENDILNYIANESSIVDLELQGRLNITNLRTLSQAPKLTTLTLYIARLKTSDLRILVQSTSITSLRTTYNDFRDTGAQILAKSQVLKQLYLIDCNIKDRGATALANMPTLSSLDLSENKVSDIGAVALAQSNSLKELILGKNFVGSAGAVALSESKMLEKLTLDVSKVSSYGMRSFGSTGANLKFLHLQNGTNIDTDFYEALAKNKHLEHVYLSGFRDLNDLNLRTLSRMEMEKLDSLTLYRCDKNASAVVSALAQHFSRLQYLSLERMPLTGEDIDALALLTSLRTLRVIDCHIDGKMVLQLIEFSHLDTLDISKNTKIITEDEIPYSFLEERKKIKTLLY